MATQTSEIQILQNFSRHELQLLIAVFVAGFSKSELTRRVCRGQYSEEVHARITSLLVEAQKKVLETIDEYWDEDTYRQLREDLQRVVDDRSGESPELFGAFEALSLVRETILSERRIDLSRVLVDVFSLYGQANFGTTAAGKMTGTQVAAAIPLYINGGNVEFEDRIRPEFKSIVDELLFLVRDRATQEILSPEWAILQGLTRTELQLLIAVFICGFQKTELTKYVLHGVYRRSYHAKITVLLGALQGKIAILIEELWPEDLYEQMYQNLKSMCEERDGFEE